MESKMQELMDIDSAIAYAQLAVHTLQHSATEVNAKELQKEIKMLSFKIFKILNLKNLARIDFLYDNSANKLYFNEVNTMPGFTNISMFPSLFNYDNIKIKELISILIEN